MGITLEVRPYNENYFQIWVICGDASAPVPNGTYTTRQAAVEAIASGITFTGV